jgi:HK97 gp10 family phage protein
MVAPIVKVEVTGKGIDAALQGLILDQRKARRYAGKVAAKFVAEILAKNTPYDDSYPHKNHLKLAVVYSSVADDGSFLVGYKGGKNGGAAWRAVFVNNGTIKGIKGQHFIEKTINEVKDEVFDIYVKAFRSVMFKK